MTSAVSEDVPTPFGVPELAVPTRRLFAQALAKGWQDFRAFPLYGLAIASFYVLAGWIMFGVTWATGHSFWLVLAAIGFPLLGPFAAVGLYDLSRRRAQGLPYGPRLVLLEVWGQRLRQLPSLCAVIVVVFLFWFFLGHMIFALFLGLKPMTNIMSSFDVFLTGAGLSMLAVGTLVGAAFAALLFAISVVGLPLLLDREVDFVSAMIASMSVVATAPVLMLGWGAFIAVMCFLALIPGFLGLLIVLPWLGHASWHLYQGLLVPGADQSGASRP